jgi:hypothetical protein
MFMADNFCKYARGFPITVLELTSKGIQEFAEKADKVVPQKSSV